MDTAFGFPIIPGNETERLQALHYYQIIKADVKASFDNIAFIVASTFNVPVALISLVDEKEVVFKGNVGLFGVDASNRGTSLCSLAVLAGEVTVFENVEAEKHLLENPLVIGAFGLKFYAGAPITTKSGYHIGTVCLLDQQPRTFGVKERELLGRFAQMVMNHIELWYEAVRTADDLEETIKKQNAHLKTREGQLSLAQNMARMASWEWQLSGTEIVWSPEMFIFWGFEPDEITVTLDVVAKMTHPEDVPILQQAVEDILKGKEVEIEYRRLDKAGNEIFILTKTIIKKDSAGTPQWVFGIDMDITHMRSVQERLRAKNTALSLANKELSSFSYVASHDLKEPLRKIQTFSKRLLDSDYERLTEKGQHYFNRIIDAAERMQQLIDSLLSYSRVTNITDFEFDAVNLNTLLAEVEAYLSESIVASGATIIVSPLPTIPALSGQLYQLFVNLVNNAIKYARAGVPPVITIMAEKVEEVVEGRTAEFWRIDVSDNGIGFEPRYADKIFEIFQRLHSKNEYEGTGIGLAICKKIVQTHGGAITATGVPGEGAVFSILFPAII